LNQNQYKPVKTEKPKAGDTKEEEENKGKKNPTE